MIDMSDRARLLAAGMALALLMLCAGCGGAHSRFTAHMSRGEALYARGDYARANVEFRNALQISPKDVNARLMAGQAALKLGNLAAAGGLFQSVVNDTPANVDGHIGLARLLILGGAADRGLKEIEPVLAAHPDNAELLTLRAAAREALKDTAGATADVDRALQLAPGNEDALALRAAIYKRAGELPQAAALLSGALQRAPKSVGLHEMLADVYVTAGEADKAESEYRALIGLEPQEMRYRTELARLYESTKRIDEAQQVLEQAVTALPQSDAARLTLVDFVAAHRSTADAQALLRRYIAARPDDNELRMALGARLSKIGSKDAAAVYEEVVRRDGTGAYGLAARNGLAVIALSDNRYGDARQLLGQVLAVNPRDSQALTLRGTLALYQDDPAAAIADFRAVARDQPRSAPTQRLLARAYEASGDTALAEQALRGAVELEPANVSLRVSLGDLLLRTGRADQAVPVLEEAVHRAPEDTPARLALVRAYLAKPDLGAARQAAQDLKSMPGDAALGYYYAGLVEDREGHLDAAQHAYAQALALQPDAYTVFEALVGLERRRHGTAQAIRLVQDALAHNPKDPATLNLLGGLYVTEKNYPLAIEALVRATELAPNWATPWRNLAIARLVSGDTAGAITAYQAAIKVSPKDPELVVGLAQVYANHGQVDQALALYEDWTRRAPNTPLIARNFALMLVTYRSDRASLDRARELTAGFALSNDPSLLDADGWVSVKRGEYRNALPALQRAAERAPDSAEIRYHLGIAEMNAGDPVKARQDLEKAVAGAQKSAWYPDARLALERLKTQSG